MSKERFPLESQDWTLVQRLLRGDEAAFEVFFSSNFTSLFRFALSRMGNDSEAAEEAVQAALCLAMTKLDTYRGEASLFSWLCTFCRHEISAYYRRRRKEAPQVRLSEESPVMTAALDMLMADVSESVSRTANPLTRLQSKELARLVRAGLDQLPPHYGQALEWKYIDGLGVIEIASRLKMSAKAAESLLTRARDSFREAFTVLCGGHAATAVEINEE